MRSMIELDGSLARGGASRGESETELTTAYSPTMSPECGACLTACCVPAGDSAPWPGCIAGGDGDGGGGGGGGGDRLFCDQRACSPGTGFAGQVISSVDL